MISKMFLRRLGAGSRISGPTRNSCSMGGQGSGRWSGPSLRQHTEDALRIQVRDVVRTVPVWLGQRTTGHQMTSRHGPMEVVVDATGFPITAQIKWTLEKRACVPGEAVLWLVLTEPHFGGKRWWFVCPPCGRRCGILYFREGANPPWGCRRCLRLRYACQGEGRSYRLVRRLRLVLGRAGGAHTASSGITLRRRPAGMRRRTFNRLCNEADKLFVELSTTRSGRARLKGMWN